MTEHISHVSECRELAPGNLLDQACFLWWLLVSPWRVTAHSKAWGAESTERVRQWLLSGLLWLPFTVFNVALFAQNFSLVSPISLGFTYLMLLGVGTIGQLLFLAFGGASAELDLGSSLLVALFLGGTVVFVVAMLQMQIAVLHPLRWGAVWVVALIVGITMGLKAGRIGAQNYQQEIALWIVGFGAIEIVRGSMPVYWPWLVAIAARLLSALILKRNLKLGVSSWYAKVLLGILAGAYAYVIGGCVWALLA